MMVTQIAPPPLVLSKEAFEGRDVGKPSGDAKTPKASRAAGGEQLRHIAAAGIVPIKLYRIAIENRSLS